MANCSYSSKDNTARYSSKDTSVLKVEIFIKIHSEALFCSGACARGLCMQVLEGEVILCSLMHFIQQNCEFEIDLWLARFRLKVGCVV